MIKIVTDSTSYIPSEDRARYDIHIASLGIVLNGETHREVDLTNEAFYEAMAKCDEIPSSSQPSPAELYDIFEKLIQAGHSVLGIFISSEMSGTYSTAQFTAKSLLEKYPDAKIKILDSRTNCMQLGFTCLAAAQAAAEGASFDEVVQKAEYIIEHSRFVFTPDTLAYLKKGGRIGNASALLGTLLQIKPILTVKDGKTDVVTKVRSKKKAIDTLIDCLMSDLKTASLGDVIVHHINCPDEGLALAKKLEEQLDHPVRIQPIGPVIGVHVGPGSIGIAYYTLPKNANMK